MKKRIVSLMLTQILILLSVMAVLPAASASAAGETLFDRFIPINQAYSASVNPYGVDPGNAYGFSIGTSIVDENYQVTMFAKALKRKDYQGHFLKISYLGTFGELDKNLMMTTFNCGENDYLLAVGDPAGKKYDNYRKTFDKDTVVISVDLYDANKTLVQNISPACVVMAAGPEGEFLTYSAKQGKQCSIYFSTQDNIFRGSDDKRNDSFINFTPVSSWLDDKSEIERLIGSGGTEKPVSNYEFIQYPELTGKPQYMTNNILSINEFIDPYNTYYQVGRNGNDIDPVVVNKIENVVDYSEYGLVLTPGVTRRSILTADGTLYGVSTEYKKEVLATGVKQAGKAHYMTSNGEVKEIVSGKVIATDCKSFAEHRYAKVIAVLKNDGSCYLGYTYLGEKNAYKKGLSKVLDNAKAVVAGGVCGEDNKFYRWKEEVIGQGYDEAAWSRGEYIQYNEYKLSLDLLTENAVRVFPYEYFTAEQSTAEEAMTGFVVNGDGHIWAFGLQNIFNMGDLGLIKHIFPIYQHSGVGTFDNGNFVGLLPEDNAKPYALVANHCSMNRPVVGELPVNYLSDVPGGYKAIDGYTYSFDNDADDGTVERKFRMKPTAFHYLNDGSEIFKALNTTTNPVGNLYLLPNVARSSYRTDNSGGSTVLLERTDGSMWMTQIYPRVSAANIVAKLGGWECSNAIQITQPTAKRTVLVDYEDLVSGGTISTLFNIGETKYPESSAATPYIDSEYYTQITPAKADQLYREGKPFLLHVCRSKCAYCKKSKSYVKTAIEREQVPVYGAIDDYSSIKFYWDFIQGNTVGTPLLILVKDKNNVEVRSSAYTQKAIDEMLAKAKQIGVTTENSSQTPQNVPGKLPSDKLSLSDFEWEVLRLVNRERYKEGLTLLAMPAALQNACDTRENELVTLYEHTRPNGERAYTAITDSSFKYRAAGENIAEGQRDAAEVMNGWMNSPGHRANILSSNYGYLGVGVINSRPPYWVQMFTDIPGFSSVTTSAGTMNFASEDAMQQEFLVCTDKNGVESYLPIDINSMTKSGNTYSLGLKGKTVTLTVSDEQIVGNFTDVKADAWYAEAVKWAVEKGITTGTSETTFSPSDTCTRAQILTFLWRAVGSPKSGAANPFTDVKADDYYYDAAVWASEKGMATGSLFEGNTPCTRASTVIYLWQNAGSPDTAVSGEFADVPADAAYAKAVSWAVRNGVTSGTSETTFSPDDTCTRGQIVTFLNRALK